MIIRGNNIALRAWKLSRYLDFYVKGGHSEYIKLQSFIDKHNLSITLAMNILKNVKGGFYSKFKAGLYKYPNEIQISIIEELLVKVEASKKMLRKLGDISEQTLKTASLTSALIMLFSFPGITFSKFQKHLEYNLGNFRRCSNVTDYVKQFVEIYNWKERIPVELSAVLYKSNKEKE